MTATPDIGKNLYLSLQFAETLYYEEEYGQLLSWGSGEIHLREIPKLEVPSQALTAEEVIEVSVKLSELDGSQVADLRMVLGEFQDLFINRPGHTTLVTHDIKLTSDVPVR